jgi:hypothetical protein
MDTPVATATGTDGVYVPGPVTSTQPETPERYGPGVRVTAATVAGVVAGVLLLNGAEVGAGFAFGQAEHREWTTVFWGDHWAWRAMWSVVTTYLAGFLAGMIARGRAVLVGSLVGAPSAVVWAVIAFAGWTGHFLLTDSPTDVPMGYRIVGSLLALATIPVSVAGSVTGAPFGAANGPHFDRRRGTLLGVRWYHYLWLPFPVHVFCGQAAWAAMYGFRWLVAAWKTGPSLFTVIPGFFFAGMLMTLQLTVTGAFRAYEALAGFESDESTQAPVWRRVLKFGFGYPLAAVALQAGIVLVQVGLARLFGK